MELLHADFGINIMVLRKRLYFTEFGKILPENLINKKSNKKKTMGEKWMGI